MSEIHGTTVLCVRKGSEIVIISDGQVSCGNVVAKQHAKKVRVIGNREILVGFAGVVSDAMMLVELLEKKLAQHSNRLLRSVIELCKEWRTNKTMYRLEASLIVADKSVVLSVSGSGDIIECEDGIAAIGSGGNYALAAAKALLDSDMSAMDVCKKSMTIAADMCVYTNHNFVIETI